MTSKSLRTPLGQVKGLGSARSGTSHFIMQRLTALALIPLSIWFCFSLASLPQMDHQTFSAWLSSPISASLMILTVLTTFYPVHLGIQVVIEDYISDHAMRIVGIIIVQFASILLAVTGVVSVLKIAMGGAA